MICGLVMPGGRRAGLWYDAGSEPGTPAAGAPMPPLVGTTHLGSPIPKWVTSKKQAARY
jgi:hypothetical protein